MRKYYPLLFLLISSITTFSQTKDLSRSYKRSIKHYQTHKYDKAIKHCLKAIKKDNDSTNAHANIFLGDLYFAKTDFKDAQLAYLKGLQYLPVGSDDISIVQDKIVRSTARLKHLDHNCYAKNSVDEDLKSGFIIMDSEDKLKSLDSMVMFAECEQEQSVESMDQCFHKYIKGLIMYHFDQKVYDQTDYKGHFFIGGHYIVEEDGTLSNIQVLSNHPLFEIEVTRILKGITGLKPAFYNGEIVRIRENLHVHM